MHQRFSYFSILLWIVVSTSSGTKMTVEALSSSSSVLSNQKNNWLVVDFDGTCSVKDTTPILPRLAGLFQQEKQQTSDDDNSIVQERLHVFSQLEQEYLTLYKLAKSKCQDDDSLFQALDRLDEVSNFVTAKVSASGVLKGLAASVDCTQEMRQLLHKHSIDVRIRPHCGSVLSKIHRANKWKLGVLSINWCPSLICASLQPHILVSLDDTTAATTTTTDNMPIVWSNQVDSETGEVSIAVPGASAKRQRIAKLREENDSCCIVYVGDSSTDLAALIEADIGILMGNNASTIGMARQWGVLVRPLSERPTTNTKAEGESVIWTTECWSEIEALLLATDDEASWFV
jgi:2-hydroxy-3-keto-5-methylthiopentenyl-1-phosphate phosphatase